MLRNSATSKIMMIVVISPVSAVADANAKLLGVSGPSCKLSLGVITYMLHHTIHI